MCSMIFNILYIVGIVGGAALTIGSLLTPAWRQASKSAQNCTSNGLSLGTYDCAKNSWGILSASMSQCNSADSCKNYFESQPTWKKVTLATMALATVLCAAAFVWSWVACCMCCCKACLTPPLPILAGLACILDIVGVAVYGVESGQKISTSDVSSVGSFESQGDLGYSMWLGIGAIVALFATTIIGVILAKVSKVSPI